MQKIKAWGLSAITAVLVLCFSLIGIQGEQPVIDVRNTPRITHLGGLSPQSPPGELFYCEEDGLRQIDVPFVAIARSRHAQVTLQLRADSPNGELLRERTVKPEIELTGPAWVSFDFESVADSGGKVFHITIAPADEAATNLSCWVRYHGQTGVNDPWGDRFLPAGGAQRGDFISQHANLRCLAFPVETLFPGLGVASLNIYDSAISKVPLRTCTLKAHDEVNAGWAFFAFDPIGESRWKRYYFELQVPNHCRLIGATDSNRTEVSVYKTFHGLESSGSPLLGMTRGTERQTDRDLVFRTWCDDDPMKMLALLNKRTEGKLWIAAILWTIATALCLRVFVFLTPEPIAPQEDAAS